MSATCNCQGQNAHRPSVSMCSTKAAVWRARALCGHISPEVTTWNYLVPPTGRNPATVIGYATSHREAIRQVCDRLRRAAA